MEINPIFENNFYAARFDGEDFNEYDKTFMQWSDLDYLSDFLSRNSSWLETDFWREKGLCADIDRLVVEIRDEALDLEAYLGQLSHNTTVGQAPDLESFFHPLGGKYKYTYEYVPSKAYGMADVSLLRIYAIRLKENCYLMVHGGIKLGPKIQQSPELEKELFGKLDTTLHFLRHNAIIADDDLLAG